MKVERINVDNASGASHIYALSWKAAYNTIIPKDYLDNLSLERWTPLLKNSPFDGYIVEEDSTYVATSSISKGRDKLYSDWGEIISIYVLPSYYHKGYGKFLLDYVMNKLFDKGYQKIYLWVLVENMVARSFYEKNGFSFNGDKAKIVIGGKELTELRYTYNN